MSENSSLFKTSDSKLTKAARAASVYEPPEWYIFLNYINRCCDPLEKNKNVRFEVYKNNELQNIIKLADRSFILLGRNGDVVHIILDHESISRVHAVIVHRNDGEVCLIDLNSTQGTYIGRHREKKLDPEEVYILGDGDIIKFGQCGKEYRYKSALEKVSFFDDEDSNLSECLIPKEFGKSKKNQKSLDFYDQFAVKSKEKEKLKTAEERQKEILSCINDIRKDIIRSVSPSPERGNIQNENDEEEYEEEEEDNDNNYSKNNQNEENDVINEIIDEYKLPISHELLLKSHNKWLSSLSWDKSGARLVSGSYDNYIKLWDFGGMVGEPHPFREIEPEEGHPIYCISHSPSGDMFIECNYSPQPRIFDRDGHSITTFIRGDKYVMDQNRTCGHTQSVVGVVWDKFNRNVCSSCGLDCTVRLWDLNGEKSFDELKCNKIIKIRDEKNKNIRPSCLTYNNEGNLLIIGCEEGSIQCFNPNNKSFYRPDIRINNIYNNNSYISCISVNPNNNNQILVRSHDDTMKIFDLRNTKEVLKCYNDLPNVHDTTSCKWNKEGNLIITGTSVESKDDIGKLVIYDVLKNSENDDGKIYELNVSKESVISVYWHDELNELGVGSGDGLIHMYFNPKYSQKGALLASNEINHVKENESYLYNCNEEIAPNILPMFKPNNEKDYIRDSNDNENSKKIRPEIEVGKMKVPSSTFTQYYLQQNGKRKVLDGDPRESLLKQDKKAKLNPMWVDNAYKKNQPNKVYMEKTLEEELDEAKAERERLLNS